MTVKLNSNEQSGNEASMPTLFCSLVRMLIGDRAPVRKLEQFGPPDSTGHIEMPLSYMAPGEVGHVLGLRGNAETRQHLLEMGFTIGTEVDFLRVAPLRDPITVRIRGYQLSLRKSEADAIRMRRCPPELIDESPYGAPAAAVPDPDGAADGASPPAQLLSGTDSSRG
jgi:ferrous iron transport protein A